MLYALYALSYLVVGFVATMSPAGQDAWWRHDVPPFWYLLLWPIMLPGCLLITGCIFLNDWLESLL